MNVTHGRPPEKASILKLDRGRPPDQTLTRNVVLIWARLLLTNPIAQFHGALLSQLMLRRYSKQREFLFCSVLAPTTSSEQTTAGVQALAVLFQASSLLRPPENMRMLPIIEVFFANSSFTTNQSDLSSVFNTKEKQQTPNEQYLQLRANSPEKEGVSPKKDSPTWSPENEMVQRKSNYSLTARDLNVTKDFRVYLVHGLCPLNFGLSGILGLILLDIGLSYFLVSTSITAQAHIHMPHQAFDNVGCIFNKHLFQEFVLGRLSCGLLFDRELQFAIIALQFCKCLRVSLPWVCTRMLYILITWELDDSLRQLLDLENKVVFNEGGNQPPFPSLVPSP